jgi:YidC/Oxa1 family membrane protein insertase
MDKNFVIAMVLMLIVFFAWQTYFGPKPLTPEEQAAALEASGPVEQSPTPKESPAPVPTMAAAPDSPSLPAAVPTPAVEIETVKVDTELFHAEISNRGGALVSWTLKKYMDKAGKDGTPYQMAWTAPQGWNALETEFAGKGATLTKDAIYEVVEKSDSTVVLKHVGADGLETTKTFTFEPSTYVVHLSVKIRNAGTLPFQGELSVLTYSKAEKAGGSMFKPPTEIIYQMALIDGKLEKKDSFKVDNEDFPGTELTWAGFSNNYFLLGVAPDAPKETKYSTRRPATDISASEVIAYNKIFSPGEIQELSYTCYIGPKKEELMAPAGHEFDLSRDFGWFSGIARFLVRVLNFFQGYVKNYGVAIIIVTVIIKILLLPLTQKSYTSMKAMQKLQPAMKEIREQYKDDKNMMNQKVMELYKQHKVNPASGCLPMLLQLPIFIAFYRALYSSIELRHEPFFGWIQDLSAPDPYFVTPILMGATMFLSQKMTPTSADPMQAKMMMAMPIVFTFFFLGFPSGLVLYWLLNNVLTIFQQVYINRTPEPEAALAEAGAGGGKRKRK